MNRPISKLIGLGAVAAILACGLAAELGFGGGAATAEAPRVAPGAPASEARPVPIRTVNEQALLDEILARPLFATDRRPRRTSTKTVTAAAAPLGPQILPRLAGIVVDEHTRLAIFQPKDTDKPIVVAEGDEIAGRKVAAISASEVVVRGGQGDEHLLPTPDPALAAAAAAMPEQMAPPVARATRTPRFGGRPNMARPVPNANPLIRRQMRGQPMPPQALRRRPPGIEH